MSALPLVPNPPLQAPSAQFDFLVLPWGVKYTLERAWTAPGTLHKGKSQAQAQARRIRSLV